MEDSTNLPTAAPYAQNMPYTDRKSSYKQPPLQISPADFTFKNGTPHVEIKSNADPVYSSNSFGNTTFMRKLASGMPTTLKHRMMSWSYDDRNSAQDIVPFLFLGPSVAAKDHEFLDKNNIDLIIAVRSAQMVRRRPNMLHPDAMGTSTGRKTATLDIDTPYDFIRNVRPAIRMIVDHLEASCQDQVTESSDVPAKVLVYCENGNERSAVLVIAVVMVVYALEAYEAFQLVQSRRFSVGIDEGMKRMLTDFDAVLKAERQVATTVMEGGAGSLRSGVKRNLSRAEEEEYLPVAEMGIDRDEDRPGSAPFRDT